MISPEFIDSDYVYSQEVPAIHAQRRDAGALVVPVVLDRCSWQLVAGKLQPVPTAEDRRLKPVMDWKPRRHGYNRAREEIIAAIEGHFGIPQNRFDWGAT